MTEGGNSVISLTEYTGVLRRWSRVIVFVVVAGALLGGALLTLQSPEYVTRALVQIRPIVAQNDDPNLDVNRQINTDTEVAIAGSQRVAERALALRMASAQLDVVELDQPEVAAAAAALLADGEVDGLIARQALKQLTVSFVSDAQILSFSATASNGEDARALAQSSAVAYLAFRQEAATVGNDDSRARLVDREGQLVAELDGIAAAIGAAGEDEVRVQALAYADIAKRSELTVIGTKFANLEALTIDPGVVLTDAVVPSAAQGLPIYAGPVMGALLGLIAALTGVFVLDRSDDRLRSGRVELGALGVPMLGTAPAAHKRTKIDPKRSNLYPVNTEGSDAYRRLHGTLLFNLDSDDRSVVLVAGIKNPVAASSVAANVSATAARAGRRTLLIGADLRDAGLDAYLGAKPNAGLSDVILDGASLADSIVSVGGVENLSYLGAGNQLDRPADVLQSEAFARLVAAVQADYDLVVIEAPPILRVADAVDVARLCDGSIVVAESGSESRQAIADTVTQLRSVGSDIVGVVVADAG